MAKNMLYTDYYNKKKDKEQPSKINTLLDQFSQLSRSPTATNAAATEIDNSVPPTTPANLLTTTATAPKEAPDAFSKYWEQPVVGKMPLDQFVRLAGMAGHALDPEGFGGRLGKDLSAMGAEAYGERTRREYESPNKLLQRQLLTAQINKIKAEQPGKWEAYSKWATTQGISPDEQLRKFTELTSTKESKLSAYKTFYSSQKAAGKTDAEIDIAWTKRQEKLAKAKQKGDKTLVKVRTPEGKTTYVPRSEAVGKEAPVSGEVPTSKQLADAEELVTRTKTDPDLAPQIDLINKYSNKDYVWEWKEVVTEPKQLLGYDIPGTGSTEGEWTKVPKKTETELETEASEQPPKGAKTGTYKGIKAYTLDEKTFYNRETGEVIK